MGQKKKINDEIRLAIRQNTSNLSITKLADKYSISRRSVQFIKYPERYEKHLVNQRKLYEKRKAGE